jgi:hypothetical protein
MQKLFCIIHEIGVLGGNISAQYVKNRNWAEIFPLDHKLARFAFAEVRSILSFE